MVHRRTDFCNMSMSKHDDSFIGLRILKVLYSCLVISFSSRSSICNCLGCWDFNRHIVERLSLVPCVLNAPIKFHINESPRSRLIRQKVVHRIRPGESINIADEMEEAGYTAKEIESIKKAIDHYLKLREEIRKASGETLDLKTYEADMRHLIDTYVQAEESRRIDPFGDQSLLEIISKSEIDDAISKLPDGIKKNQDAVAETIENNVRHKIIKEHLVDPAYYEQMSKLLSDIIKERKAKAVSYEEYLKKISELARRTMNTERGDLPTDIQSLAQRALYRNLGNNVGTALAVDTAVQYIKKADWRGNTAREKEVKAAIYGVLKDAGEVERIFPIIKQQYEY
jgi:type I restriction enzyme, R subunit